MYPFTYDEEAVELPISPSVISVGLGGAAPPDAWHAGASYSPDMDFSELFVVNDVSLFDLSHADREHVKNLWKAQVRTLPVALGLPVWDPDPSRDSGGEGMSSKEWNAEAKRKIEFELLSMSIELFTKSVGLVTLKIAVPASPPTQLNAVIEVLNAARKFDPLLLLPERRTTAASPLDSLRMTPLRKTVSSTSGASFFSQTGPQETSPGRAEPLEFSFYDLITSALNRHLGAKGSAWKPSTSSDRLFTYVTIGADFARHPQHNPYTHETWTKLAYHLATCTRLTSSVDDVFVDEYTKKNGYSRFQTPEGGTHIVFSHNGGAALVINSGDRKKDRKKFEQSQKYTQALIQPMLYQWTYLQLLGERLSDLMIQQKHANCVDELARIHGAVLEFRARFFQRSIFIPRSMKMLSAKWQETIGLDSLNTSLGDSISDLHSYYSDMSSRVTQQRLDVLAVILGMLTLAELVISVYCDDSPWWVPLAVVLGFSILSWIVVKNYVFTTA